MKKCRCLTCSPLLWGFKPGINSEYLGCIAKKDSGRRVPVRVPVQFLKDPGDHYCDIRDCDCLVGGMYWKPYMPKYPPELHEAKWGEVMRLAACIYCLREASLATAGYHESAVANCWRCERCLGIFRRWLAEWDDRIMKAS